MQVCAQFFDECMAFLQSSEEVPPKCAPIFLGPDIGLANVFKFNDETGDCDLSITELGNVCRDFFEECMSFLESSEEVPPRCEPVFLGPDVGLVNVFTFNDATQDCQLSMQELAKVCTQFFNECMAFLESSEDLEPECEDVFLGPDIGFVNVFEYSDEDDTCNLSMAELAAVCAQFFNECLSFLESDHKEPECEAVFLGPDIGFANIFTYSDQDETCGG